MQTLYHVTYARNLEGIASSGLNPGRSSNFGGAYRGHSSGRVFLCDFRSVKYWIHKIWDMAEANSDYPLEDGLIPIALKVKIPRGVDLHVDEAGSRDSRGEAYFVEESIPASNIMYWDGFSWDSISSAYLEDLIDEAKDNADLEDYGDGEIFYDFGYGDHFAPKKAALVRRVAARVLKTSSSKGQLYYRIQDRSEKVQDLLNPDRMSHKWVGDPDPRRGVSVTRSVEDLIEYFAEDPTGFRRGRTTAEHLRGAHLVVLEGVPTGVPDHDANAPGRPLLIAPTRIVKTRPLSLSEVVAMLGYDTEVTDLEEAKHLLNDLAHAGWSRDRIEDLIRIKTRPARYPLDALEDLLVDAKGS